MASLVSRSGELSPWRPTFGRGWGVNSGPLYEHGALHALGVLDAAPEYVFDDLAHLALEVSGASGVEITFADGRRQLRKASAGTVPPRNARLPAECRIPVTLHSGLPVGELVVYGRPASGFRVGMLERIARQAGAVLDERLAANWHSGSGAAIGVVVLDSAGTLLSASPDLVGVFGWTVEECVGRDMLELVHPEDLEGAAIAFERSGHIPGLKTPYDVRLKAKDGTWLFTELTADNRLDDPSVQGIVYTVRLQNRRPLAEHMLAREAAISQRIASGEPLDTVVTEIAKVLDELVDQGMGAIFLVDSLVDRDGRPSVGPFGPQVARDVVTLHAVTGGRLPPAVACALEGIVVGPEAPPPGRCVYQRQSAMDADVAGDTSWGACGPVLEANGLAACWAVPILDADNEPLGAVVVFRTARGRPTIGESSVLWICCSLVTTAISRERTEAELVARASRDPLTDLPNRAYYLARLEELCQEASASSGPAVIFMDLDRFNVINDSLGHEAGDRLLREAARRLADALGPKEMVARFGGDEFAFIVPNASPAGAMRRAQQLLAVFDEPLVAGSREIFLNASAGVVCAGPGDLDPNVLLQHADAALYRAKELGRGQAALFDDEMKARALDRLAVEHGLRTALREHELVVHFQPQFTIDGSQVAGAEALVRWHHPQWGLTPPSRFIHIAEETGVIGPVTEVVLAASCGLARSLAEVAGDNAVPIWVNLSASQLSHPGIVAFVARVLVEHAVAGSQLGIEITEGAVMLDAEASVRNLGRLRDLGLRLGIDDFGTGYSSLSYLRGLPVDLLKLDQSFLAGLGDERQHDAIVRTVFELAHTLEMTSLAEGVETQDQVERLAEMGCDLVQGFLFARPAPAAAVLAVLAGEEPTDGQDDDLDLLRNEGERLA